MIDTHAHLNLADYQKDLGAVINRAQKRGVNKIICISTNLSEAQKTITLAKKYPGLIFPALGIHPHQTDPENQLSLKEQIDQLASLIEKEKEKIVAIGECGLDYSLPPPPEKPRSPSEQLFLFEQQLALAQQFNLPVIIHARQSFKETIAVLEKYPSLKGVFHCYSGGKKGIPSVEKLGFLFGFDGNLTYDFGLQKVVAQIPLEKIILETDSPFLSPEPYRGKRNEPAFLIYTAQKLATLKKTSLEKIDQITTENTLSLFRL